MNIEYNQTAIIVMDICDPEYSQDYFEDEETNENFVYFLNNRLKSLQKKGSLIIEVNYIEKRHFGLDIDFDYSTTDKRDLEFYLSNNIIDRLVYTGFHYPVCTNYERELSSYNIEFDFLQRVDIAPFLCRSLPRFDGDDLSETQNFQVGQIIL